MAVAAFSDPDLILGSEVIQLQPYGQRFILHPGQITSVIWSTDLKWETVRFSRLNAPLIADSRGIYAFIIRSEHSALPPHGYVTYIGITGDEAEGRTLRIRYGEYIQHQGISKPKKRVGVNNMLRIWRDCLFFSFACVSDKVNLGELEITLNDCLIPPFVTKDFSPSIRAAKAAFELR